MSVERDAESQQLVLTDMKKPDSSPYQAVSQIEESLLTETLPGDENIRDDNGSTSRQFPSKCKSCLHDNLFLLLTLVGIVVGFVLGLVIRDMHPSGDALLLLGLPGELYLRILKAIVVPLIVCNVIVGTATTDPKSNGRISLLTFTYILGTNALCGLCGMVLYFIVDPGPDPGSLSLNTPDTKNLKTLDIFIDFIRNLFPDNIVAATMQQAQTKYNSEDVVTLVNVSGHLVNVTSETLSRDLGVSGSTNLIGLIVVSAAFGISASQVGSTAKPFVDFFDSANIIIFRLFDWIKWTTPIGVAGLIVRNLAGLDDLSSALNLMGIFVCTICVGLLLYEIIVLTLLYLLLVHKNPFPFFFNSIKTWLVAFGSASSSVALPEMFKLCEDVQQIDPRVVGLVIPTCVTLNRDGSTLFITTTCLFVAAYTGYPMDSGTIVTLVVLSIMSALAVPSVPSASIVTTLVVLSSVGIPPANIGLILAVEFINDRIRTTTNVLSSVVCAEVVWHWCKDHLYLEEDKLHCEHVVNGFDINTEHNNMNGVTNKHP